MLKLKTVVASLLFIGAINAASAAVVIDPSVGRSGSFNWMGGLGPIDGIDGTSEMIWSLTVAAPGTIDISVADGGIAGDAFELVFDGSAIPWTSSGLAGGYFFGNHDDLFLTTGTHTFTLNVVADCCGAGAIDSYRFSAVTSSVPEPASVLLLGLGALGLAWTRRAKEDSRS